MTSETSCASMTREKRSVVIRILDEADHDSFTIVPR